MFKGEIRSHGYSTILRNKGFIVMPYNYSYTLDPNPKLVPIGNIKFDPVTDEYRNVIEKEKRIHRLKHRGDLVKAVIFFVLSLILFAGGAFLGIRYALFLLFLPVLIGIVFLVISVIMFVTSVSFKVTGIKAGTVTHRETHQYNVENNYNQTLTRSTDRVTVRIDETGDEVSVITDSATQMHCTPDRKVWLLKTSTGAVISLVR